MGWRLRFRAFEHLKTRFGGRDGIGRALYVTTVGRRVVVVQAFVKKTQRTPKSALDLAERRTREIKS
jgi:phage-related protein